MTPVLSRFNHSNPPWTLVRRVASLNFPASMYVGGFKPPSRLYVEDHRDLAPPVVGYPNVDGLAIGYRPNEMLVGEPSNGAEISFSVSIVIPDIS